MLNRRTFLKQAGITAGAIAVSGCVGSMKNPDKPLNILLITADDLNYDSLGCFGNSVPGISPNLDRLAAEGLRFNHAHVDVAVCTPCRSTILTGRYPHNNGSIGFYPISEEVPTLNEVFHQNGYLTGICGKGTISSSGLFYKGPWDFALGGGVDFDYARNVDLFYKNMKRFLDQAGQENRPFFFMMNSSDPHRPFHGSQWHTRAGHIKRNSTIPDRIYKPDEIEVPGFLPDLPQVREELAQYFTSVKRLDQAVGTTLQALDDSGFTDNTLVMFLSDNGMAFPFSKTYCYLQSTKTPWLVRWPGRIEPGRIDNEHFINSIDFMPTALDAAGIKGPTDMDGKSFLPVLLNQKQSGRKNVFTQFDQAGAYKQPDGKPTYRMPLRAVQNKKWGYIFNPWANGQWVHGGDTFHGLTYPAMEEASRKDPWLKERIRVAYYRDREEFFDLENDPDCLHNLINKPEYQSAVNEMRKELRRYMVESNDYVLAAFDRRRDQAFLAEFMQEQYTEGKAASEFGMKAPLNYIKHMESESPTGVFHITLTQRRNVRLEVWTWHSEHVNKQLFKDAKELTVDLSGHKKGVYQFNFHFDDQVITRKVRFQ